MYSIVVVVIVIISAANSLTRGSGLCVLIEIKAGLLSYHLDVG